MQRVFDWRNSAYIVERSSSRTRVEWVQHVSWFTSVLNDPGRLMLIIEIDGTPTGVVRFDTLAGDRAVITVYMAEKQTGRGAGVTAIKEGCRTCRSQYNTREVIACVRSDNLLGERAFLRAGFVHSSASDVCPAAHVCLSWPGPEASR